MKKQRTVFCLLIIFSFIFILGFSANLPAQTSPLWGELESGEYGAGFKTIEKYDYSRTFRSQYGYFGEIIPGENARMIQICLWYPAQQSAENVSMVLGEYAFPIPDDMDFFKVVTAAQQRELQRLVGLLGNNRGLMMDATNIEMGAVRDADPADGKFPLLVYFPNLMSSISDNFVLCEYLASHGFVVMTTHMFGTYGLNPGINQVDFETVVRDKEFALANIRNLDFINMEKIGTFGIGGGALAGQILQMRNYNIEAVASLAGWNISPNRAEFISNIPNFAANRMAKPLLQIYYDDAELFDLGLIDSIKYCDRFMVKLDKAPAGGFTSYPAIQSYMDTLNVTKTIARPNYDLTCEYLLEFCNLFLKNEDIELSFASETANPVEFELKEAMKLPPTSEQFVSIIQNQGGQEAVKLYNKFNETDPGSITFQEAFVNMAAYGAMQRSQNDDALALFKLNAETYPNSTNVWDSYSDGLQAVGNNAEAIKCYQKVLEVLKVDTLIDTRLSETLKTNAVTGIERLSNESN